MSEAVLSDAAVRAVWMRKSLSRADAARMLGCSQRTLQSRARAMGLPGRKDVVPDDAIRALWSDPRLTRDQIADRLGMAQNCVWRRAKKMGLPARRRARKGFPPFDEALFRRMWLAGVASAQIGRVIGRHRTAVNDIGNRLGLPKRPHGSARLPMAAFLESELGRAMAVRAAREQAALRAAGMMTAPGVRSREVG